MTASAPRYKNTPEQQAVVDAAMDGATIGVQACAGAGKTSTLVAVAHAVGTRKSVLYLAYNTALASEGKKRFPETVTSKTTHGLAYTPMCGYRGAVWPNQKPGNATGRQVSETLGLRHVSLDGRTVTATRMGYMVLATMAAWCHSADDRLQRHHFRPGRYADVLPPPEIDVLRRIVVPAAADLVDRLLPERERDARATKTPTIMNLPFSHDMYLKQYVRMVVSGRIEAPPQKLVMVDEFQDSNALILQLVRHLTGLGRQVIAVGDPYQQIYEWRGSVDALSQVEVDQRLRLRQSFRFGPETAALANDWLRQRFSLDEDLVFGNPAKSTPVSMVLRPDEATMILCRNNKSVAEHAVALSGQGRTVLLPKGHEVAREIEDIEKLRAGVPLSPTSDYAVFTSFDDLMEHADSDEGKRLKTLLKMIAEYSAEALVATMHKAGEAYKAHVARGGPDTEGVVICTGHASKGLESRKVILDTDFNPRKARKDAEGAEVEDSGLTAEDARVLYVAMTRAQEMNDVSRVSALEDLAAITEARAGATSGIARQRRERPSAKPPQTSVNGGPKKESATEISRRVKRGEKRPLPW